MNRILSRNSANILLIQSLFNPLNNYLNPRESDSKSSLNCNLKTPSPPTMCEILHGRWHLKTATLKSSLNLTVKILVRKLDGPDQGLRNPLYLSVAVSVNPWEFLCYCPKSCYGAIAQASWRWEPGG